MSTIIKAYLGSPVLVVQDLVDGTTVVSAVEIVSTGDLENYTLAGDTPAPAVPAPAFVVQPSAASTNGKIVSGSFGVDAAQPVVAAAISSPDYSGPDRRIFTRRTSTERRHG